MISSEYFLPYYNKGRIMIAGFGEQVNVFNLAIKTDNNSLENINEQSYNNNKNDKRSCDCCLIF